MRENFRRENLRGGGRKFKGTRYAFYGLVDISLYLAVIASSSPKFRVARPSPLFKEGLGFRGLSVYGGMPIFPGNLHTFLSSWLENIHLFSYISHVLTNSYCLIYDSSMRLLPTVTQFRFSIFLKTDKVFYFNFVGGYGKFGLFLGLAFRAVGTFHVWAD